jgi:hypothetical protein
MDAGEPSPDVDALRREVAERDRLIASLRSLIASLEGKIAALQSALIGHANENELLKRRLFGPRSERGGTNELQLLLGELLADQQALQKELDSLEGKTGGTEEPSPASPPLGPPPQRPPPKGRRDLSASKLPRTIVEIRDAELDKAGSKLIGWEDSHQLMHVQAAWRVLVTRTAKYEVEVGGRMSILGVEAPETLFPRSLLHPGSPCRSSASAFHTTDSSSTSSTTPAGGSTAGRCPAAWSRSAERSGPPSSTRC